MKQIGYEDGENEEIRLGTGDSLPEPADNPSYTYFNAEQEAYDLHAIVQMLKKNLFKTGKWASTGTNKTLRDACNKYILASDATNYRKILDQYNQHSPMSTGDLES